jgi:TIR domain/Nucleoside 2-deoxyribosyltransferase
MTKYRIFLSYSAQDRKLVTALERALERLGVSAFNPADDVKAGSDWREAILDGIRKSDRVVVLLTQPHVAAHTWTGYEVGAATALGKEVVVMKPSDFSIADLPGDLASWRTLDVDPSSPEKMALALVSSMRNEDAQGERKELRPK